MKILNKLLLTSAIFATAGILNVNATTYAGTKKYNFKEIESNDMLAGLISYNGKTYASKYLYTSEIKRDSLLYELKDGDKITLDNGSVNYNILDTLYPNENITFYDMTTNPDNTYSLGGRVYSLGGNIVGAGGSLIESIANEGYIRYITTINDKVYGSVEQINEEHYLTNSVIISIDTKDNNSEKTFRMSTLLDSVKKNNYNYSDMYLNIMEKTGNRDPFIVLRATEENISTNEELNKIFIFNYDGTLYKELSSDKNIDFHGLITYNGEENILFSSCDNEENRKCSLSGLAKNGKETQFLKSSDYINAYVKEGFIVVNGVNETDTNKYINRIYDMDFNIVYNKNDGSSDAYMYSIRKEISSAKDVINNINYNNTIETIQNSKYLITMHKIEEDVVEFDSNLFMTVENSKTTTISGVLKDKEGKALKDYKVELHSIVRTTTTDENGYFKFDNVEEGKHTLTIKKSDGTIITTKEINVYASTETKLEGDTLYFNQSDTGLNFEIKIEGETLSIDKVEPGSKTKEEVKTEIEKKQEETKEKVEETKEKVEEAKEKVGEAKEDAIANPKTFDSILKNSVIVLLLISLGMIIIKKKSRIKVAHIK